MFAEKSAYLWDDVRFFGPFVDLPGCANLPSCGTHPICESYIRGMAGKFVDTISIFNRKRNSVKMNTSGFAKIFHEEIDEIL